MVKPHKAVAIELRNEEFIDNYITANLDEMLEYFEENAGELSESDKVINRASIETILKSRASNRKTAAMLFNAGEYLVD